MTDTPETEPPPETTPPQKDLKPKEMSMASKGIQLSSFEDAWRFCQIVHRAHMQPDQLKTPEMILVALQTGLELGLLPMQAIQSICVINGRPSIWGDAVPALILASGQLTHIIEEIVGEGDKMIAICKIKRKGFPEVIQEFSLAEAKQANLANNPKKPIWKLYPQRMLKMRARSWACRDLFADVLKGIAIAEEVQDYHKRDEPRQSEMDTTEPETHEQAAHDPMMGPKPLALPEPEPEIELAPTDWASQPEKMAQKVKDTAHLVEVETEVSTHARIMDGAGNQMVPDEPAGDDPTPEEQASQAQADKTGGLFPPDEIAAIHEEEAKDTHG